MSLLLPPCLIAGYGRNAGERVPPCHYRRPSASSPTPWPRHHPWRRCHPIASSWRRRPRIAPMARRPQPRPQHCCPHIVLMAQRRCRPSASIMPLPPRASAALTRSGSLPLLMMLDGETRGRRPAVEKRVPKAVWAEKGRRSDGKVERRWRKGIGGDGGHGGTNFC